MNWFLIALAAPALWSATNYVDKYLISKYFQNLHIGALFLFSTLAGLFALPFIYIFHQDIFNISIFNIIIMMGLSLVAFGQLYTYFYAIRKDEVSIIVPLFQTIPIFSYILGYLVLGETLTLRQVLGSILIIVGAIIISLDLSNKMPKVKMTILLAMLLSSFLVAFESLVFKMVALEDNFLTTTFWRYAGDALLGLIIFIFIKTYRVQFLQVFKKNRVPLISINVLNETLNMGANICIKFATLLAPLALVWIVNGFQPFFVFIFGVLITLFFPNLGSESLIKRHIIQKIGAIIIMFAGTVIITVN